MRAEVPSNVFVNGVDLDAQTRCVHWHSPLDVIAIKFKCCGEWYACYDCHSALADHAPEVWPRDEFGERAILCGECKTELPISEYLASEDQCPKCKAAFNPGCANHYDLYFQR
jgi:uncharacterized CHY-type Zn-finger protein